MLAVSDRLDIARPEASVANELRMVEMRDNGAEARKINEAADGSRNRSVYLPLLRGVTPRSLEAFDPVSQSLVSGARESTTVPTQALYLLNSSFVRQQALASADHVLADSQRFDAEWVSEVYLRTLGRTPTDSELARAGQFLAAYASSYRGEAPVQQIASVAAEPAHQEGETGATTAVAGQVANPDDVDRSPEMAKEIVVQPTSAKAAAWMALIQAIYASAEFRFVR
jgi:hypothetical protein